MRYIFLVFAICSSSAHAFQCPPENSLVSQYTNSERVFLIYVTKVELEDMLLKEIAEEHGEDLQGEWVKLTSASYRIVEDFKGDASLTPKLLDMFGIGTGYVGFTPGLYYLLFLEAPDPERALENMRWVSFCDVRDSHYRLEVESFQESINEVRRLAQSAEANNS